MVIRERQSDASRSLGGNLSKSRQRLAQVPGVESRGEVRELALRTVVDRGAGATIWSRSRSWVGTRRGKGNMDALGGNHTAA